jgi:hypothetical protein
MPKEEARIVVDIKDLLRILLLSRCSDGSCSPSSDLLIVHKYVVEKLKTIYPARLRKIILQFYQVKDEEELVAQYGDFPIKVFNELFGETHELWIKRRDRQK